MYVLHPSRRVSLFKFNSPVKSPSGTTPPQFDSPAAKEGLQERCVHTSTAQSHCGCIVLECLSIHSTIDSSRIHVLYSGPDVMHIKIGNEWPANFMHDNHCIVYSLSLPPFHIQCGSTFSHSMGGQVRRGCPSPRTKFNCRPHWPPPPQCQRRQPAAPRGQSPHHPYRCLRF
jgi:hypothetical protein